VSTSGDGRAIKYGQDWSGSAAQIGVVASEWRDDLGAIAESTVVAQATCALVASVAFSDDATDVFVEGGVCFGTESATTFDAGSAAGFDFRSKCGG
jgi:hypothetical protein